MHRKRQDSHCWWDTTKNSLTQHAQKASGFTLLKRDTVRLKKACGKWGEGEERSVQFHWFWPRITVGKRASSEPNASVALAQTGPAEASIWRWGHSSSLGRLHKIICGSKVELFFFLSLTLFFSFFFFSLSYFCMCGDSTPPCDG